MKTTRVGGGHPDYVVRADPDPDDPDAPRPTYQQDLWHYTIARMVDACVTFGILPYYGPFGDIKDTVACEDQFRNAYLLGCVGAWSLHPAQIEIAKRVFSPRPADVAQAQRVIDAMGDGTGAIMLDGKMEDDASVKQCKVVVELARQLAARDPELAAAYGFCVMTDRRTRLRPRRSVLYMPAANERALEKAKTHPGRRDHLRPRGRRRARRQGRGARPNAVAAASSGEYGSRELTIRCNGLDTPWGADDIGRGRRLGRRGGRDPEGRLGRLRSTRCRRCSTRPARRPTMTIWAMIETPTAIFDVRAIAAHPRVSTCW